MLVARHFAGRMQRQRGADRVGATGMFSPQIARRQGDTLCFMQKIMIAAGFQHQPGGIRQHQNGVSPDDLGSQAPEQRARDRDNPVVLFLSFFKQGAGQIGERFVITAQTVALAALPGVGQQAGEVRGRDAGYRMPGMARYSLWHRALQDNSM